MIKNNNQIAGSLRIVAVDAFLSLWFRTSLEREKERESISSLQSKQPHPFHYVESLGLAYLWYRIFSGAYFTYVAPLSSPKNERIASSSSLFFYSSEILSMHHDDINLTLIKITSSIKALTASWFSSS
jgi:hypothetical protein